mmetsp:Transcript_19402/g.41335  ORF Transcript_19402/g.41335 Transcript_19402/m.41335 type:complete len:352 (+) Transcript_19402:161-1216(+)
MGGAALAACSRYIEDQEWEPEEVFLQKMLRRRNEQDGTKLLLSVIAQPSEGSAALPSSLTLLQPGEEHLELWVERLEAMKGWAPLQWRYLCSGVPEATRWASPTKGPSLSFWRARLTSGSAEKGFDISKGQWCLLQVATATEERTAENARLDIKEWETVANYAHKFNLHILKSHCGGAGLLDGGAAESVPDITVCAPLGCRVVETPVPQIFAPGDVVTLLPYRWQDVTKFVFDGREEFLELPHAFFHYISWISGGHDCVGDLQGIEDENGSILLVNPWVPREVPGPDILSSLTPFGTQTKQALQAAQPTAELFERLHTRCGPLCKTFDPDRRGKPVKRACGVPMSCGVTGQ